MQIIISVPRSKYGVRSKSFEVIGTFRCRDSFQSQRADLKGSHAKVDIGSDPKEDGNRQALPRLRAEVTPARCVCARARDAPTGPEKRQKLGPVDGRSLRK